MPDIYFPSNLFKLIRFILKIMLAICHFEFCIFHTGFELSDPNNPRVTSFTK